MEQHLDQPATPETSKSKMPPTVWTAFVTVHGVPKVLTAKYQKDLKKTLNEFSGIEVMSIMRGKTFGTKVVTSIDFAVYDNTDDLN